MKASTIKVALVATCVAIAFLSVLKSTSFRPKLSPLQVANLEALANIEDLTDEERPPEWWDFFNNYEVEERIPINSSNCIGGKLIIKGITIQIGSCSTYTYAIYHHCYDGGNRDECTSSYVHTYI